MIPSHPTASIAVIDCETATADPASACSIGWTILARGSDGGWSERDAGSVLVRPPGNRYAKGNIEVHGITADETADAPALIEAWGDCVRPRFVEAEVGWLCAFNTPFDAPVLWASLQGAENQRGADRALQMLRAPVNGKPWLMGCVMRAAFSHFRNTEDVKSRRLEDLCEYAGIDVGVAHTAGDDSRSAAMLLRWMMQKSRESFPEIVNNLRGGWTFFGTKGPSPVQRSMATNDLHGLLMGVTADGRVHPRLLEDHRYWGR